MSDSLRPHGLQHARPPCPSQTPGVHSNSCPLSRWCHPTISSSVSPFSSRLQSFPASGSSQMSQIFALGGQRTRVSASASVLPMNTQDWSPCSPRDSQKSSPTTQFKSINSSALSFFFFSARSFYFFLIFPIIFISWRLITLQYCSGFCHTLTWISHGFTCVPLPDPSSHLPLHRIPLGLPSVPALSTCLMHPTWAGDLFHPW